MGSITRINVHPHFHAAGMMRYELPDGKEIYGFNYTELVQQMADEKLSTPQSLGSYRRAVCRRLRESYPGIKVRYSSDELFIKSLINIGQLT